MKRLINRIKAILKNSKGETLMESIASLLVLSILMAAVTAMIVTSLRITALSTKEAAERQDNMNNIIMGNAAARTADLTLTGTGIDVTIHDVQLSDEGGYLAFDPPEA